MRGIFALAVLVPALVWAAPVRVRVQPGPDVCRGDRSLTSQLRGVSAVTVVEREFDFEAALEPNGADWRISLRRPDGSLALQRTLAGSKECADAAFAAALVIERFARELDLKVELPLPPTVAVKIVEKKPEPKPAPTPAIPISPETTTWDGGAATEQQPGVSSPVPAEPVEAQDQEDLDERGDAGPAADPKPPAPTPSAVVTPPTSASTIRVTRWEVSAGGAGWGSTTSAFRAGFHADAAVFLVDHWRLAAQLALTTPETTRIFDPDNNYRGDLITQPFLTLLGVDYCLREFATTHLRPCAGIAGGAHLELGSTQGEFISYSGNRWLVRPALGLEVQLAWLPIPYVSATAGAAILTLPVPAAFEIKMLGTHPLPLFEGLIRLCLVFGANR